ncbi:VOC family protein [Actinopolymorpha sp. B11F2]|uniref:VOC family protein n=1 Tax=Actinopolymorpha sp. B11F2 TaxID=3160862 RepID=UPI0032E373E5
MVVTMYRLSTVILNVPDVDRAAEFWSKALEPTDNLRLAWRTANSVAFQPSGPGGVGLTFNANDQTHFDLNTLGSDGDTEERDADVARLLGLGARRVEWPHRDGIVVLEDPNGLKFCVIC